MMDITTLRIVATVASFITFIGIFAWAWSDRRDQAFEAASRLPFEQE
jgi:cytochrome c oxidase cbb3-type subunit 4